jgi:predicted dehydrogenase
LLREAREFIAAGNRVSASYRISAGRLEKGHWAHELDSGGGRILGEVGHFIDALRFLVDADVDVVHAVAQGDQQTPLQARDNVAVDLAFTGGSIGTILYVADGSPKVPKEHLEAFAGDRTAVLDDYRTLRLVGPTGTRKSGSRRRDKGHEQEVAAFLDGVARGEAPAPLREVANVSVATLAIVESMRTGRAIRLTP